MTVFGFLVMQLLGRADNVSDFVRRGEQEGYVEVTLKSGNIDAPLRIKRKIKARDNSSSWEINGRPFRCNLLEAWFYLVCSVRQN